jgi:hypothetical protein
MSFAIVRGYLLWSLGPWGKQYNDMLDLMHFDPLRRARYAMHFGGVVRFELNLGPVS